MVYDVYMLNDVNKHHHTERPTMSLTTSIHPLAEVITGLLTRKPVAPILGDVVRGADGALCCIVRIGWNGEPSPFYGDKVLRAYVFGFEVDDAGKVSVWCDWVRYDSLKAVDAAAVERFCVYVRRDLKALVRDFRVVRDACNC